MSYRFFALCLIVNWYAWSPTGHYAAQCDDQPTPPEIIRFLKVTSSDSVKETECRIAHTDDSLVITSTTQRGEQTLTVASRFDSKNRLTGARVTRQLGQLKQTASVLVRENSARVLRDGKKAVELACPPGVIITSAPDWTDAIVSVQRYDLQGSATQEFPALWIHPTREPLALRLKLTRAGRDTVIQRDQKVQLDRFLLVLRGGTRYIAWRSPQGRLVRLAPAMRDGGIVLAGWESATRDLKTRPSTDRQ